MNDPNRAALSMAICTLSEEGRKKALANTIVAKKS